MNVYDYLLANAKPTDVAVITRHESASYSELASMATRIGDTLRQAGISRGERVGILAENSVFWIACYLGILRIGAVAAPFPARLSPERLATLVALTQTRAICADEARLRQHKGHMPGEPAIIVAPLSAMAGHSPDALDGHPDAQLPGGPATVVDDRAELAALMFTSGSTGEPNAVKVSHRNIMANADSIIEYIGLAQDDRMMVLLPFDYCFGLSLLHTHLRVGGTVVLNNTSQLAEDVLDDMERYACTGFAGVPAIYQHFLRRSSLSRRALPHFRHAQQAGGKLPNALISEFHEALPNVRLFVMYGQTEATSRLSYLPPERLGDKLGSIGRGIPRVRLQVLDPFGRPVAPGEIGEIVAAGENVTLGYWVRDPAKESFRDGKLYTGDLARVDDDGFIYVVGRTSDFIKPSGHRISAKEIEDLLAEIPDVIEVAVVGVPDPDLGEAVKAFLVTSSGREIAIQHIRDHCRGRLPIYAIPRQVAYLPSLPKNGAQKVLKHALPA